MIYLDYAATTPIDPRVANKMGQYLTTEGHFGNASSQHPFGIVAKKAVENAREQVANLIQADPSEIIFTSGATEANNLALKGAFHTKGKHIITFKTEHPSILETCQYLEKQGYNVSYLTPQSDGLVNITQLEEAFRPDTMLVSIMHVNNEIGVIQDLAKIANLTAARNILLHVDAAQSAGKIPIDVNTIPIDLMSFSAHKIYGPKGIGALYIRRKPRVRLAPLFHGGGQEQGMRAGTLAVHQIVGMGEAFALASHEMSADFEKIVRLRERFLQQFPDIHINGNLQKSYPGILNVRFNDINARDLLHELPLIAASVGSACLSKGIEPSYVLRALGQTAVEAHGGVRFSFGRFSTESEIDKLADFIKELAIYKKYNLTYND